MPTLRDGSKEPAAGSDSGDDGDDDVWLMGAAYRVMDCFPVRLRFPHHMPTNVLGQPLIKCCSFPRTGFYRDGYCRTGPGDTGLHTVCACMTAEFLEFSRARGYDLLTPRPEWDFPGLVPGDYWCVCVSRWAEALDSGAACPIRLEATHSSALEFVDLADLQAHAI